MNIEHKNIIAALIKAQKEFEIPSKSGINPMFKSRYATLDDIYIACRDALSNNGLVLSHTVEFENDRYYLLTTLYHVSGETLINKFPMVIEKQTNQGIASARTYACRYATANLLALPSDEDDDGNMSTFNHSKPIVQKSEGKKRLSPDQIEEIADLIGENSELGEKILRGYKVSHLRDIEEHHYQPIVNKLKSRVSA